MRLKNKHNIIVIQIVIARYFWVPCCSSHKQSGYITNAINNPNSIGININAPKYNNMEESSMSSSHFSKLFVINPDIVKS